MYSIETIMYGLVNKEIISLEFVQTNRDISPSRTASLLVYELEKNLESSLNPEQYLTDICHVLMYNEQYPGLVNIATSVLHQLHAGECILCHSNIF